MLVSFNWIKEFIDTGLSAEETAHALTMAGLEVEGLEKQDDGDYVLEVNVTPNRPDCLSVLGIARELHAITGKTLKPPPHAIKNEPLTQFNIDIKNKDLCARYTGRVVKGVTVAESPDWLKSRLERSGIRAINNVVDITNYVLLELGHPLHAFDLDTLEGGAINVAVAGKGQRIITIDGVERALPEDALLIWDGKRPVAIAGIMGGLETEVKNSTTNILLESAWFKPQSVRRTCKALGLRSESSYRFERGTDVVGLETALDRTALLITELAGGTAEVKIDVYPVKFSPGPITLRYDKIAKLLGVEIPHDEITDILRKLGLEIHGVTQETFVVTAPSFRPDLTIGADILEEVARLYGYGKIPITMPVTDISSAGKVPDRRITSTKEAMRKEGLNEAINYSFMNEGYLDILKIPEGDSRRKTVRIKNPLRAEDAVLRTMLVPSLIENFLYNLNRGTKEIRLFEISKVFEDTGEKLPRETLKLCGILFAERKPSLWKESPPDFYRLKGALESLFHMLRIPEPEFRKPTVEPFLHPGKSADIYISGKRVGFTGELSPDIIQVLDVKTRQNLNLFELDMEVLLSFARGTITYSQIPRYPAIERDISLVVDEVIQAADIVELIRSYPEKFMEEVSIFDTFTGKNIPKGKKSLAFSLRYRSPERTLTDEEVEKIHQKIVTHVTKKTGGEIRA